MAGELGGESADSEQSAHALGYGHVALTHSTRGEDNAPEERVEPERRVAVCDRLWRLVEGQGKEGSG